MRAGAGLYSNCSSALSVLSRYLDVPWLLLREVLEAGCEQPATGLLDCVIGCPRVVQELHQALRAQVQLKASAASVG